MIVGMYSHWQKNKVNILGEMDKAGNENGEMEKVVQGYFMTKTGTSYQRL